MKLLIRCSVPERSLHNVRFRGSRFPNACRKGVFEVGISACIIRIALKLLMFLIDI